MPVTAIPGSVNGSTSSRRMRNVLAPSIAAACSSSAGTASMKFFISQIAKGKELAERNNAVAYSESSQPKVTYIW